MSARWWNVNEDGEAYDSHPTEAAALLVQAEYPNDVVVQASSAVEAERLAFPAPAYPQCFAGHEADGETFEVSLASNALLSPVTACADHVGDLLGNVAKATTRAPGSTSSATIRVVRSEPASIEQSVRQCECHVHREQRRANPRLEGESPYDYARRLAGQPAPRG